MGIAKPEHWEDLDSLRDPTMPLTEEMSLQRQRQSLAVTVMKRSWRDAGETLADPGSVREFFTPETGTMVVEFEGARDIKQLHIPDEDLLVIEFEPQDDA